MTGPNVKRPPIIRFSIFELDLNAGELRRNGAKVKIQEQPFQILATLLERPGEIVTREELSSKLWPADTFVDFDHGLNAAVRRLRETLGDSAEIPRFVETVARRGYRFIGTPEIPAATASVQPAAAHWRITATRVTVAGVVSAALVLAFLYYSHSRKSRAVRTTIVLAVTNFGEKYTPS